MSPISAQERTMKYRSMMSEQKKRYVREEGSERKREEKKTSAETVGRKKNTLCESQAKGVKNVFRKEIGVN